MRQSIDFLTNFVHGGWSPTDKFLRGTEDSIVQWAKRLAGEYQVTVWHNSKSGFYEDMDGVHYADRDKYIPGADLTINVKCSDIAPVGKTLYFTNETNASELNLSEYLGVIHISEWAKQNIPVNNPNVYVVPHGYNPELIYPGKKIPKQCFYASSPDRGLDTLLEAWPRIYEAHPDATLLLTYRPLHLSLPGVISLGELNEEDMAEVYRTSEYWLYPCNGGELFCITGVNAQVAHCWPIYFPTMALPETVRYGTVSSPETFTEDVIRELNNKQWFPDYKYINLDESTQILRKVIEDVLK